MLSRVAESIYWMSRQVERAENIARFLEVTHNWILDQPDSLVDPWAPLISVTADYEVFKDHYGLINAENVTRFLAFDPLYVNSMLASLRQARENARGVRECLSNEVFEQLNEFYQSVKAAAAQPTLENPSEFFESIRRNAIQWTGTLDSTMSHDTAWHFATVGRMLERADKTSRILDVKYFNILPHVDDVGTAVDDLQWTALLNAIGGFESYRRDYHLIEIPAVVEFFLFNKTFPRSVQFCVDCVKECLSEIIAASPERAGRDAFDLANALGNHLRQSIADEVIHNGMHDFIDELQLQLNGISSTLHLDYFYVASTE